MENLFIKKIEIDKYNTSDILNQNLNIYKPTKKLNEAEMLTLNIENFKYLLYEIETLKTKINELYDK